MPAHAQDLGYTIKDYQVQATLHKNNTVTQTETIHVHFNTPRHGIYRSIPESFKVGYKDSNQVDTYSASIKNISVEGDTYDVSSKDGYKTIKIGDADRTIIGDHTYKIKFTYVMPADYRDNTDFIFYSVLGAQWDTTIEYFAFDMKFDQSLNQSEVDRLSVYSGYYGGEENDANIDYKITKTGVSGQAYDLEPQQAVTIFGYVRQGYFVGAKTKSRIFPNVFAIIALFLSILVLGIEGFKKRKSSVEVVEFYPPDDLDSAQVGYIVDESADLEDIMSLIPYWGNKGYIKIKDLNKKEYSVEKIKDLPENVPLHQRTLFALLFKNKKVRKMKNLSKSFMYGVEKSKSELSSSFFQDKQLSTWDVKGCAALVLALVSLILMFGTMDQRGFFDGIFSAACTVFPMAIALFLGIAGAAKARFASKGRIVLSYVLRILLLGIGVLLGIFMTNTTSVMLPHIYISIIVIVLSVSILWIHRLNAPTDYWVQLAGRLKGFKTFIQKAEVPQLEKLSKENPNYFFDVIPYAMVFGLAESWAKRFKNIPIQQPEWYVGTMYGFNSMYYYSMIHNAATKPVSTAISAHSAASSSSFGGFAGGGGGGGGGGSW